MTYEYRTTAAAVATVSSSGVITGIAPGSAMVTVTATGTGTGFATHSLSDSVRVLVNAPPDALTSLEVTPSTVALQTGSTQTLAPSATAAGTAVTVSYAYATSSPSVATVSNGGVISAIAPGSATITVTATGSGTGFAQNSRSATVAVTVAAPPPALTALSVSTARAQIGIGDRAQLLPSATTATAGVAVTYTYTSSAPSRATVNESGLVTAIATGSATITVSATGNGSGLATSTREATLTITVAPQALGIGFGAEQFSLIPSGSFQMGSENYFESERPVRTVTISRAFRVQKTEVTQGQWLRVMQGTSLERPSSFTTCGTTCPVESVRWNEIQTFLERLNEQDPGKGYRLLTEAEWEYAARAGTSGDYGGTGVLNDMGWWFSNSSNRTHPVARKSPNGWGLYDMHGNVWEWVNDWYAFTYYSTGPNTDPPGPATGETRMIRGGSWFFYAGDARSSMRLSAAPTFRFHDLGFRIARDP